MQSMPSPTQTTADPAADPAAAVAAFSRPIEIFAAGTRACDDGRVFAITQADLKASADAYDPALHEAPLVLGHPDHDSPAWGGVKALQVDADGKLSMLAQQVAPAFAEGVQAGRYKKRSACFYEPTDPNNPKPGIWYLRHVGFLGAKPPAVKGLRDVRFAQGDTAAVSFSESDGTAARLWRSVREFLLTQFGADTADRVAPDYLVASLERKALADELTDTGAGMPGIGPAFSEPTPLKTQEDTSMDKELQAKLEAEEAARKKAENETAALRTQLAAAHAAQTTARHASHVAFAEGAVRAGQLLPKDQAELVAVLDQVADAAASKPVQFGEGDAARAADPVALIQRLVSGQAAKVQFGEFAPGNTGATTGTRGMTDADLDKLATAHAAQHRVSYAEALRAVCPPSFTA